MLSTGKLSIYMGLGGGNSWNKQYYLYLSLPPEKVPCNNKLILVISGMKQKINTVNSKLCGYRWFQLSGVSILFSFLSVEFFTSTTVFSIYKSLSSSESSF